MRIARIDLLDDFCPDSFTFEVDGGILRYTRDVENIQLFYACDPSFNSSTAGNRFVCSVNGTRRVGYGWVEDPNMAIGCELNLTVPVLRKALRGFGRNETTTLREVLDQGFEVEYETDIGIRECAACERSGGLCWPGTGTNSSSEISGCLCSEGGPRQFVCPPNSGLFLFQLSISYLIFSINLIIIKHSRFKTIFMIHLSKIIKILVNFVFV